MLWECEPDDVEVRRRRVSAATASRSPSRSWPASCTHTGGPVVGRASVDPEGSTNGFGVHIVDVEVDPETGKVTILRYTAVQDAGKAIHPSYVEGQMQGGAVQGIGWALNEEYFYDDQGRMRNASFLDYRMPTALDVPMIDTIIVEVPNPAHPYGVRGVGETPIVAPAGRGRQRHLPRHRRADARAADVAAEGVEGTQREEVVVIAHGATPRVHSARLPVAQRLARPINQNFLDFKRLGQRRSQLDGIEHKLRTNSP